MNNTSIVTRNYSEKILIEHNCLSLSSQRTKALATVLVDFVHAVPVYEVHQCFIQNFCEVVVGGGGGGE